MEKQEPLHLRHLRKPLGELIPHGGGRSGYEAAALKLGALLGSELFHREIALRFLFFDAVLQHDADVGRHDACSRFLAARGRAGSRMNQVHAAGGAALEPQEESNSDRYFGNHSLKPQFQSGVDLLHEGSSCGPCCRPGLSTPPGKGFVYPGTLS